MESLPEKFSALLRMTQSSVHSLERIANTFTANWIPASAGMTLLVFWSVIPAQPVPGPLGDLFQVLPGLVPSPYWEAGSQNRLDRLANANENRATVSQSHVLLFRARFSHAKTNRVDEVSL